jgi:hypothetical protein
MRFNDAADWSWWVKYWIRKKGEEHFQVQLDGRFTKKKKREQISAREMIPRIFGRQWLDLYRGGSLNKNFSFF